MKRLRLLWGHTHSRAVFATTVLAIAGGAFAAWLNLPLAWLLGSVVTVGLAAALGIRIGSASLDLPPLARAIAIPLIGTGIGAGFTPAVVAEMPRWWITILALVIFLPLLHYLVYRLLLLSPHISQQTAWYSAVPGGLVESIELGQAAGGDVQMMTMLHVLRMIACVILVPLGLALVTGLDTAGVVVAPGSGSDLVWWRNMFECIAITLVGVTAGRLMRLPAASFFGPLLVSAVCHASGLSSATISVWVIIAAQIIIGANLGARFEGMPPRKLILAIRLIIISSTATYALTACFAWMVARLSGMDVYAIFLAYAPGGIIEMSLIAMAMQLNPIFVSTHHLLRIMIAIIVMRWVRP
ncbi:AbrB family transcriptional regulator [Mesorhizobium sp. CAU 1732]|uniref:AbrB family transcriptional regulator n=1 Tax=Mesorhizobium sp. CAU 1732 TaxID=3140358 RepID=UPI0032608635